MHYRKLWQEILNSRLFGLGDEHAEDLDLLGGRLRRRRRPRQAEQQRGRRRREEDEEGEQAGAVLLERGRRGPR